MSKLNIAFFGTPELAIPILESMKSAGFKPRLVVTMPDMPSGRKLTVSPTPVKEWAIKNKIKFVTPTTLDADFLKEFNSHNINLGLVVAYGKILPADLIDSTRFGMINVHYSLLPKYRGATPVESAILNGDKVTGVTIQRIALKLDAGQVILQKELEILPDETTPELKTRLNEMAKDLVVEALIKREKGSVKEIAQDESKVTNCKKTKKEDGEINPAGNAEMNYRKYRAYFGWPGIYFFLNKKRIKITKARLEGGKFVIEKVIPEGGKEKTY